MRKRWGIWVLFLLGFLCCCLPLLAHLYSQKEQEQVIATYQKTIQDQKLDVKELRKVRCKKVTVLVTKNP